MNQKGKAKLRLRLFLCLCFCTFSFAEAQYKFTPELHVAYAEILDLRISRARMTLDGISKKGDTEAYHLLLRNYADVAELLVTDDLEKMKPLMGNENVRLNALSALPDSPHKEFIRGAILWQWALVKLKNGKEIRAAWDIRKAYLIFERLEKENPELTAHKVPLGAMKVMVGSVPERYSWIMSTFGLEGTVEEGINLWMKTIASDEPFAREADVYLQTFRAFSLSDHGNRKHILGLMHRQPQSLLAHFIGITYLMKMHDDATANSLKQDIPHGPDYVQMPYLELMKGELDLRAGNYDSAIEHFNKYLSTYRGSFYRQDAYYRLALAEHLKGNSAKAHQYLQIVLVQPAPKIDADRAAVHVAETGQLPDRELTKLRLLIDGGHYIKAEKTLKQLEQKKVSDRIDLEYRRARLQDLKGNTAAAIKTYQIVINSGIGPHGYLRPNACLLLGHIYQEKGEADEARYYFKKVLEYEEYPYKASLDNKAKAALEGL